MTRSTVYGGRAYALTGGSVPMPTGVRRLSASLAVASGASVVIVAGALLAYAHVSSSPAMAAYSIYDHDFTDLLGRLGTEAFLGASLAVVLAVCAVLVTRPRRPVPALVLIGAVGALLAALFVTRIDVGLIDGGVAVRELPGWYPLVQAAEIVVMLAVLPAVRYARRRAYLDFYQSGEG
jgi:hypothetical protein